MHVPTVSSRGSPNVMGPKPSLSNQRQCGWPPLRSIWLRTRCPPEHVQSSRQVIARRRRKNLKGRGVPCEGSYGGREVGWFLVGWLGVRYLLLTFPKHPVNPPTPWLSPSPPLLSFNYNATKAHLVPNANWSVPGRECRLNVVHWGWGWGGGGGSNVGLFKVSLALIRERTTSSRGFIESSRLKWNFYCPCSPL